jgi:hypothetical protein
MLAPIPASSLNHNSAPGGIPFSDSVSSDTALAFHAACKANFAGSAGQQRVLKSYLERVLLPLPALDEQRRIVGKNLSRAGEEGNALEDLKKVRWVRTRTSDR